MASSDGILAETISLNALLCEGASRKFPEIPLERVLDTSRLCRDVCAEGVLSCRADGFDKFIEEGKGLNFENKTIRGVEFVPQLYVPIPPREFRNFPLSQKEYPLIGVPLKAFAPKASYGRDGSLRYVDESDVDNRYLSNSAFTDKKTILFFSGPDLLIEGLSRDRITIGLGQQIGKAGFDFVTTPDFSVNSGSCYPGQICNLNRSLAAGEEIEASGVGCVPNVFAIDDHQRRLWADYLKENAGISLIAINCQLQGKSEVDMAAVIKTVEYLIDEVPQPLHVMLRGYKFTNRYLRPLQNYRERLHFADSAPFYNATANRFYGYRTHEKRLVKGSYFTKGSPRKLKRSIEIGLKVRRRYLAEALAL